MKTCIKSLILALLIVALLPINTLAATDAQKDQSTIYLDNGCYITVELSSINSRASGTKTGSKTYTYRDSAGAEEWRAVLKGTFTYTGSSATCTSVSCNVTITDTAWYTVSKTTSKSGGSALCELIMGRKFLGITIGKETVNMRITCDANGNLS